MSYPQTSPHPQSTSCSPSCPQPDAATTGYVFNIDFLYDPEAERCVAAFAVADPLAYEQLSTHVNAIDFYVPVFADLFIAAPALPAVSLLRGSVSSHDEFVEMWASLSPDSRDSYRKTPSLEQRRIVQAVKDANLTYDELWAMLLERPSARACILAAQNVRKLANKRRLATRLEGELQILASGGEIEPIELRRLIEAAA